MVVIVSAVCRFHPEEIVREPSLLSGNPYNDCGGRRMPCTWFALLGLLQQQVCEPQRTRVPSLPGNLTLRLVQWREQVRVQQSTL